MARKTTKRTQSRRTAAAGDPDRKVVEAALHLAAVQGWRDTTMADIAAEAGVPLAELRHRFSGKQGILAAFSRQIDETVLAGTDPDIADEPVRDRLFDLLIRRLDALKPYRDGVAALAAELRWDPPALACLCAGPLRTSMQWTLDAARVDRWGPLAPLQLKGLGLIYLGVLRVWLRDQSDDYASTMAALDKALNRADSVAAMLRRRPRRRGDGVEAAEAPEA